MKYGIVKGKLTHIKEVKRGQIGLDNWFKTYKIKACKGKFREFWAYLDKKPNLPHGYENETEWHASWKELIKDDYTEVICGSNNEHRADIKVGQYVVEIQHSSIDGFILEERIDFYFNLNKESSRVIWVIDVQKQWKNKQFKLSSYKTPQFKIKWRWKKDWALDIAKTTKTNLFLEYNFNSDKLILCWWHKGELYGKWVSKWSFLNTYCKGAIKDCYNTEEQVEDFFKSPKK